MAAFNKFNAFIEHLAEGVHHLGSDALKVALTNTLPDGATAAVLADIAEIDYTHLSSRAVTTVSSAQTGGTYKLVLQDLVLVASGGDVGPFRYAVLYNDTPTSPADPLIGFYDREASITLSDGDDITIDFEGALGALTLA